MRIVAPDEVTVGVIDPVAPDAAATAKACLAEIAAGGEAAVRKFAEKFGDVEAGAPLLIDKAAMKAAFDALDPATRDALERTATRVRAFADAQRASVTDVEVPIPGGFAGHTVAPVEVAGCYAPGGRYPLPSSVIMTVATARAAGVPRVIVASPHPVAATLAAAHVAGADVLLPIGGAQAIAALAHGSIAGAGGRADVICGPGNRWVTAAKSLVAGTVCGIDMLAGPSEVLVIADKTANVDVIAADLLAQAEHDVVARPIFIAAGDGAADMVARVNAAVQKQLAVLPTAAVAREAVKGGFAVACETLDEAIAVSDRIAPEHLEIMTANSDADAKRCKHYGGLFIGTAAAEVLGDYGIGPNHTLPTGGTARYSGGLSVFNFLRVRTWMRVDDPAASEPAVRDAVTLARVEGLEGHARAAEARLPGGAAWEGGTSSGEPAAKKPKPSAE